MTSRPAAVEGLLAEAVTPRHPPPHRKPDHQGKLTASLQIRRRTPDRRLGAVSVASKVGRCGERGIQLCAAYC
jgi:hypothetical protein